MNHPSAIITHRRARAGRLWGHCRRCGCQPVGFFQFTLGDPVGFKQHILAPLLWWISRARYRFCIDHQDQVVSGALAEIAHTYGLTI
jgi:hypothetical protein